MDPFEATTSSPLVYEDIDIISLYLSVVLFAVSTILLFMILCACLNYWMQDCQIFLACGDSCKLVKFKYRDGAGTMASDCGICQEDFKQGDRCSRLLECNLVLHVRCIDRWLKVSPTCPTCRAIVDEDHEGIHHLV